MVKISVVMPVYNCESYIERSIKSILNQSFNDIELICVEDGSSDNTLNILNEIADSDSRVKVYSQENQGASIARNKALELVTGDYVYFFDADDQIVEDGLLKLYNNAVNNDSDIVICRFDYYVEGEFYRIDKNFNLDEFFTDVDFDNFSFTWQDIKKYVLRVNTFAPWFKLYKREFLDKYECFEFPPHLKHNDVPFHVKTLLKSSRISFVPEFLYHYTNDNPNSITNNPQKNQFDIFHIIDIVEDFLREEGYFELFEDDFYFFKVKLITRHMDANTQEYFNYAKKELSNIDLDKYESIRKTILFRANATLESDYIDQYHFKNSIHLLEKENAKLSRQNDKLKNQNTKMKKKNDNLNKKINSLKEKNQNLTIKNKKLKSDLKESKRKYREILNSSSWRITKPFRKFKHLIK